MVDVGSLDDLGDRTPCILKVAGREIALLRWDDRVYALRNLCPHQSQSFLHGSVHERVLAGGSLGEVTISAGDPVLSCPWHSWEFELATGQCAVDPRLRVRTYPTRVENGRVLVDVTSPPARESP